MKSFLILSLTLLVSYSSFTQERIYLDENNNKISEAKFLRVWRSNKLMLTRWDSIGKDNKRYCKLKQEKNITIVLSDSSSANIKWSQISEEKIKEELKEDISEIPEWKTVILVNPSVIKRVHSLIKNLEEKWRYIFFTSKDIQEIYKTAENKKIIKDNLKNLNKIIPTNINSINDKNKVFIVTWNIDNEKSIVNKIISWNHSYINLEKWDNLVLPSSCIFPDKKDSENIINKLICDWVNVLTFDNLDCNLNTHPLKDDLLMLAKELKPRYVLPINWDWILRAMNKKIVSTLWYKDIQVPMLNNWEMIDIDFKTNIFKSNIKAPIQNIISDGHWIWVANSHVIKARKQMMNSWVLVIVFNVKEWTREIMWQIRLETRGLVYLEEVRQIHRIMIKKSRAIYENTIIDVPEIENKDLIKIIKTDLENYILKAIDREPMIIPIIIEAKEKEQD